MRRHRIIFLAAVTCATGCTSHKKEVETARHSLYDAEFSVVYTAALEATRESYPNIEDAPGHGSISTSWHQVTFGGGENDMNSRRSIKQGTGMQNGTPATQSTAGMPTRLAYERYYIRFDISVAGGRPWRLKVVGHAGEWATGAGNITELHGGQRPSWLELRTDALVYAIYDRVKKFAVPMPEGDNLSDEVKRSDPAAFGSVPGDAGKELALIKDALAARDYATFRSQLADDVLWSLGGGSGADGAMAMWQADPEPLDAMAKVLAGGCGGDAKRVSCPAGAPAAATYQLVLEPRGTAWRITSFVKAE